MVSIEIDRARPTEIDRARPTEIDRAYNENKYNDNKLKENKENIFLPLAQQLSKIIQSRKNTTHTKTQLNAWVVEITAMIQKDKISLDRIKTALEWYSTFIGGEYVPVIESGRSLREKFFKLENAIERSKMYKTNNTNNQVGYKSTEVKFNKPSIKM
jgi:hypothetical protein